MKSVSPRQAMRDVEAGRATLVDVREPGETASLAIDGAMLCPLSRLGQVDLTLPNNQTAIFFCRSGMRTNTNSGRLASLHSGKSVMMDGGISAWAGNDLPVIRGKAGFLDKARPVLFVVGAVLLLSAVMSAIN